MTLTKSLDTKHSRDHKWIMDQARRYPLLTAEQEILYSRKIQQGVVYIAISDDLLDTKERLLKKQALGYIDKMVLHNIRLVISMVNSRYSRSPSPEDLIGVGLSGLREATIRFDSSRGYRFSTYAWWWIRQSISRYLYSSRVIRLPIHVGEKLSKLKKVKKEYFSRTGKHATREYLAQELEMTEEQLDKLIEFSLPVSSLNHHLKKEDGEGAELGDMLGNTEGLWSHQEEYNPDLALANKELADSVEEALQFLSPRERDMVRLKLGFVDGKEWSLQAIGDQFGLTRERIRQIISKAYRKLRGSSQVVSLLKDFTQE